MKFFRYLWLACSGFRTYRAFLDVPFRSTVLYWAALSAILATVAIPNLIQRLNMAYPLILKHSVALPEFSLKNGVATSALPQPYYANTNDFPLVLDLAETIKEPHKLFPQGVVIHKHGGLFWSDESSIPWEWNRWPDGTVNTAYLQKLRDQMSGAIPIVFVIIWLGIMLLGLLQALTFTMLAGILERSISPSFTFNQLFNISLFALTPGCIIIAVYASIGFHEIRYELLYFGCYCLFLIMASGMCRSALLPQNSENSKEDEE